ncbi:MFS transporter [Rhodococcus sp. H29-C3]|uniref:MFS transporter n=1 Tax=Rhodococcus sp. H29-C3 TaxID=3046307 RepID=UPI0024BB8520|nr:MFS transporter [Rhodococcus sp. H29-C3]MDJ0363411.1 MFS transporter [Rhodococcus sp. H29-C3]
MHPAWRMAAVAAAALMATGSYTTIAGLITEPLATTQDWSRGDIGIAVAINMVLYGAVAPFSAALMDRYGIRKIAVFALLLLTGSSTLLVTATPSAGWFIVWWGLLVGVGTGSITMVFGATVANRWFADRIGLATGILTSASVVGQFAILPLLSTLMSRTDWRAPITVCGALAAGAAALTFFALRENPIDLGVTRYGSNPDRDLEAKSTIGSGQSALARTLQVLRACVHNPAFWLLSFMFFLCGATTNGLLWSHFTPAAHDHGMAATAASSLLAMVGIANILGTVSAGWLSDRMEPRVLLAGFFLVRGSTLAVLPLIFTSQVNPSLVGFAIMFGILDVATVPPTIALCRHYFGADSALAFGWVNVAHQIGAGAMAVTGGLIRESAGAYTSVWILSAFLCVTAATMGSMSAKIHIKKSDQREDVTTDSN